MHAAAGLSCVSCHKGDPSTDDMDKAKDPRKGFVAKPKGWAVAQLCGSCHADIERMRIINPRLPTSQLAEYRTSEHGKLAVKGNLRVATCVSCHGNHGIKHVTDAGSPASKGRIVETCTHCHNAAYMKGVSIPTDQLEKYTQSVHGQKRLKERDAERPRLHRLPRQPRRRSARRLRRHPRLREVPRHPGRAVRGLDPRRLLPRRRDAALHDLPQPPRHPRHQRRDAGHGTPRRLRHLPPARRPLRPGDRRP